MGFRFATFALAAWLALNTAFGTEETKTRLTPTELAKQDQNPIARILRVQIEDNIQFGFGPHDGTLNFLRIQPAVAFGLTKDWSLVMRPVIPIVHQPWPESADGLGDIGLQLFLTPHTKGKFIWGFGPALVFPSATHEIIGTKKWSAGPTGIVVYSHGPWVVGLLLNQIWSFAGDDNRRGVDAMTLRPIINFNLPHGWYITTSPSMAANWKSPNAERWLVPVGGGVGKAFVLGSYGLTSTVEAYAHVLSPDIGPDWQMRFQVTVLFPK
ncbi:MAG: neuromedin U [Candidatus Brocadia sp.]|nr:MAG: neuromedin U [Candidatus Brocadia sp.]